MHLLYRDSWSITNIRRWYTISVVAEVGNELYFSLGLSIAFPRYSLPAYESKCRMQTPRCSVLNTSFRPMIFNRTALRFLSDETWNNLYNFPRFGPFFKTIFNRQSISFQTIANSSKAKIVSILCCFVLLIYQPKACM